MGRFSLPMLLKAMVDQGASDMHLTVGAPPEFRIHGRMVKIKADPLAPAETKELCYSVLNEYQKAEFEKEWEIDFAFALKDISRFRGNLFFQRGSVTGVFRKIPYNIPEFETLGLPGVLTKMIRCPNGLILVTGPTGSGKSTTLASLLDILNREEQGHLITVEDPIEFVHSHKQCIVNQREVGGDTKTFHSALRRILRQDPDYVLVGELRDSETIEMALTMAETGHLVFASLHTNGAVQSINRVINVFPSHQQNQVRQVLAFSLQGIVSQMLVPSIQGGRALACEVMVPHLAIRNLIREDKIHQIYAAMQAGQSDTGMITMNQSLMNLVRGGIISKSVALEHSTQPEEMYKLLQQVTDKK